MRLSVTNHSSKTRPVHMNVYMRRACSMKNKIQKARKPYSARAMSRSKRLGMLMLLRDMQNDPSSPAYEPEYESPEYDSSSPAYEPECGSPGYDSSSPAYEPECGSPGYDSSSPAYEPFSPYSGPTSPYFGSPSPVYETSPWFGSPSPAYEPSSPYYEVSETDSDDMSASYIPREKATSSQGNSYNDWE